MDVSDHHDTAELLVLADALITDYSSIMFDYALLDRPVVLFAPDLDAYAAERGSYFDLREKAPGPVAETEDELFEVFDRLKAADTGFQAERTAFAREFGGYDRGTRRAPWWTPSSPVICPAPPAPPIPGRTADEYRP